MHNSGGGSRVTETKRIRITARNRAVRAIVGKNVFAMFTFQTHLYGFHRICSACVFVDSDSRATAARFARKINSYPAHRVLCTKPTSRLPRVVRNRSFSLPVRVLRNDSRVRATVCTIVFDANTANQRYHFN